MHPKKRRLFIGIPLSDALRKRLGRDMASWEPAKEALILTPPENLHVTLFYLGFVEEEAVPEICRKAGEACEAIPSFELDFTETVLMDGPERPKMIWLSGEASEPLKNLREAIEKVFASFVTEKKSFRPHVTLAKIKKAKWQKLPEKPKLKEKVSFVEPVDAISVFESLSINGKRRYDPIDTFPLG